MEREIGQHFLINKEVLKKEIEIANISKEDKVIEIGAGKGDLTREILKKTQNLLTFEIDESLKEELEEFKENLVFGDATKRSWKGYNKIVSNIPYNLSEQIIQKAIKENIQEMILVVGENFKEILEKKDTSIGIISDLFFLFQPIELIKKDSFSPKPRVNSWLIKLRRKESESKVNKVLQNIFLRKGKIKNAILYSLVNLGYTKNESREILEKMEIEKEALEKTTKTINGKVIQLIKKKLECLKWNQSIKVKFPTKRF